MCPCVLCVGFLRPHVALWAFHIGCAIFCHMCYLCVAMLCAVFALYVAYVQSGRQWLCLIMLHAPQPSCHSSRVTTSYYTAKPLLIGGEGK